GPAASEDTIVTDTMRFGLSLPPIALDGRCTPPAVGPAGVLVTPMTCHLGRLAAGASTTITYQALAAEIGTFTNIATVSGPPDINPSNNTSSSTYIIGEPLPPAALTITKAVQPASTIVGGQLTFTITVRNTGGSPNPSTIVRDDVLANVS